MMNQDEDMFYLPELEKKDFNEFLTCFICKGYYRDATTINECNCTFCKGCIIKYFAYNPMNDKCPKCLVRLGGRPLDGVTYDITIQTLVDILHPDFKLQDEYTVQKLYETFENANQALPEDKDLQKFKYEEDNLVVPRVFPNLKVTLLPYQPINKEYALPLMPKTVFRMPDKLTIWQLKKFLTKGMPQVKQNPKYVDLLCRNQILNRNHTLEFIKKTLWADDRDESIVINYQYSPEYFVDQTDQKEEKENIQTTFLEMESQVGEWTLDSDQMLCKHLEDLTTNLVSSIGDLSSLMGGLQKNAQAANIRLKNTLNRFSLFSTSKFVENSVRSDDIKNQREEEMKKTEDSSKIQVGSGRNIEPNELLGAYQNAVNIGLTDLKLKDVGEGDLSMSESDKFEVSTFHSIPVGSLAHGVLPFIIGSAQFRGTKHIGLTVPDDLANPSSSLTLANIEKLKGEESGAGDNQGGNVRERDPGQPGQPIQGGGIEGHGNPPPGNAPPGYVPPPPGYVPPPPGYVPPVPGNLPPTPPPAPLPNRAQALFATEEAVEPPRAAPPPIMGLTPNPPTPILQHSIPIRGDTRELPPVRKTNTSTPDTRWGSAAQNYQGGSLFGGLIGGEKKGGNLFSLDEDAEEEEEDLIGVLPPLRPEGGKAGVIVKKVEVPTRPPPKAEESFDISKLRGEKTGDAKGKDMSKMNKLFSADSDEEDETVRAQSIIDLYKNSGGVKQSKGNMNKLFGGDEEEEEVVQKVVPKVMPKEVVPKVVPKEIVPVPQNRGPPPLGAMTSSSKGAPPRSKKKDLFGDSDDDDDIISSMPPKQSIPPPAPETSPPKPQNPKTPKPKTPKPQNPSIYFEQIMLSVTIYIVDCYLYYLSKLNF